MTGIQSKKKTCMEFYITVWWYRKLLKFRKILLQRSVLQIAGKSGLNYTKLL